MRAGLLFFLAFTCCPTVGAFSAESSNPLPSVPGVNLMRAEGEELYLRASDTEPWSFLGTSDDPVAALALRKEQLQVARERFEKVLAVKPGDMTSQERIVSIESLLEEQRVVEERAQQRIDSRTSLANSKPKAEPVCTAACEAWKAAAKRRVQNGELVLVFSGLLANPELSSIYFDVIEADLGVDVHYSGCVAVSYGNPYYRDELVAYLRERHGSDVFEKLRRKAMDEYIARLKTRAVMEDRAVRLANQLLVDIPGDEDEGLTSVGNDSSRDQGTTSEAADILGTRFVSGITWSGFLALLQSAF